MNERSGYMVCFAALVIVACMSVAASADTVSLQDFRPVGLAGLATEVVDGPEGAAISLKFTKTVERRRLVAVKARPAADLTGARSLDFGYRLEGMTGQSAHFAVILFDGEGGSWYQFWPFPVTAGETTHLRIPIDSPAETAFSAGNADIDWSRIRRVWLGLAIDGKAEGMISIYNAAVTDKEFKPTSNIKVPVGDASNWSKSEHSAVDGEITITNEGPEGQKAMKYEFTAPGGSHRWAIPQVTVPSSAILGNYSALQFRYRAELPEGIDGLLIVLAESGGEQYYADPAPKPSDDWTQIKLPFSIFKKASWGRSGNGKLDLSSVNKLHIGMHGTPADKGGKGLIMATDIEFVP